MNKLKYEYAAVAAVSLLIVLPFLNQAFYIDDFIYLDAAVLYNQFGFESFRGQSDQEGFMLPNYYLTHPLVWPWFIAAFIKLFNTTGETALHLMAGINVVITGFSSILICKRLFRESFITTVLFLLMPAVMLLSHVIMTDIPTLAFFLLALALHIEGIMRNSKLLLIAAGISAAVSGGISYQALFLIFLLVFYNLQRREKRFISYVPVIIPSAAFFFWFFYTWSEFGIPHPFVSFMWGDFITRNLLDDFAIKLTANINAIGAAAVFPLFILAAYWFSRFRKFVLISVVFSFPVMFLYAAEFSVLQKTLFIIYFSSGLFSLLRMIIFLKDSLQEKDKNNIFLAVWFITFTAAIIFLMPLGVARYLLPGLLPFVIVTINDLRNLFPAARYGLIISACVLSTALWGMICSVADYKTADTYRAFSKEISTKYKGERIWFSSDGLQWYMERENYKPLLYGDRRPQKGDLVATSTELWPFYVNEVMERTELLEKIVYDSWLPVRTMNQASYAGFHDHYSGLLPFSITRGVLERFYIYRVIK
jgi:4-amino-4-deoxy-L-arabinose transferase-like glycosyltransferase